ncbi:21002_t:CDS:2, partial [Entrophospora sp. SA101]
MKNLPSECLQNIFFYIDEEDFEPLLSALLVNHQWCNNIIPILWKRPFTLTNNTLSESSLAKIINIYLKLLPDESIDLLNLKSIISSQENSKPKFNYAEHLREFDFKKLYEGVGEWWENFYKDRIDLDIELMKLSFNDNKVEKNNDDVEWNRPVQIKLCDIGKYISKNNHKLQQQEVADESYGDFVEEKKHIPFEDTEEAHKMKIIQELIKIFIAESKSLDKINIDTRDFYKGKILNNLLNVSKNINKICVADSYKTSIKQLILLIKSQQKLETLYFIGGFVDISNLLWSLESQAGNLKEIQLINCFVKDIKSIKGITSCSDMEELKKLIIKCSSQLEEIKLNLDLYYYVNLINIIAENCPNLKLFSANIKTDDTVNDLFNILMSCRFLESIIIFGTYKTTFLDVSDILPQMGLLLPPTIKSLDITRWTFPSESLDLFLRNCDINIKFQYLSWHCYLNANNHILVIEKYAKERNLSIKETKVDYYEAGYGWNRNGITSNKENKTYQNFEQEKKLLEELVQLTFTTDSKSRQLCLQVLFSFTSSLRLNFAFNLVLQHEVDYQSFFEENIIPQLEQKSHQNPNQKYLSGDSPDISTWCKGYGLIEYT